MKKVKLLYMLFALFMAIGLVSCDEVEPESCDGEDIAEDYGCPTGINVIATFCSDGISNSYYTYGGEKYECTGVEANTCDSALVAIGVQIVDDKPECSTKKSGDFSAVNHKLTKMAEQLLLEVKAESLDK